jgi:hypothetical protein
LISSVAFTTTLFLYRVSDDFVINCAMSTKTCAVLPLVVSAAVPIPSREVARMRFSFGTQFLFHRDSVLVDKS